MKIELKTPLTAETIRRVTNAACTAEGASIRYIATHSTEVGHDTLFLALKGERSCGEQFRDEVISRGGYLLTEGKGEKSFTVSSVPEALFALAKEHLSHLHALKHTIGITGSTGKTTTKELLFRLLSPVFRTHATAGNQNSEIGLPLTILAAREDTEVLILEMGMNHKGEIARLSRLCAPDLAIITNIGHAHIGNLGSRTAIAEAKKEILLGAKANATVLVPADEPLLADVRGRKTVSTRGEDADYSVCKNTEKEGYVLRNRDGGQVHLLHETKDEGLISAMAFAYAAAMELKIESEQISCANFDFTTNIFRQKELQLDKMKIIFDAYNASFESVLCAIQTHLSTPASTRALLLGDMLELGAFAEELHERIGYACAAARDGIHQLYLFGAQAETIASAAIRKGFEEKSIFINADADRPDITSEQILRNAREGTCLWIKGARGMHMERILDILTKTLGGDPHDG